MGDKSWVPLSIRKTMKARLMVLFEEDKKVGRITTGTTFNSYMDEKLEEYVITEENLRKRGALLEFRDAVEDHVLLFDNFLAKPIVVSIRDKDKTLYCEHDKKKDCIHVGFCYGISKVYRILIERGFSGKKH